MDDESSFPLRKILTIDARLYCESVGKPISDFKLHGVHSGLEGEFKADLLSNFAKRVPMEAEVVVAYRASMVYSGGTSRIYNYGMTTGVALIPKDAIVEKEYHSPESSASPLEDPSIRDKLDTL